MSLSLAKRIAAIHASPTLAMSARVAEMRKNGADIISFGAGEPDFPTPDVICEAGIEAIRTGHTKYTASAGTPELRQAVAEKLRRENHIRYETNEVCITCGAKHAVYQALMALCEEGDEVILPAPYWPTYVEQIKLSGATPIIVNCKPENGYLPDYDDLRAAVSPRTKAFLLTTPHNPTGAVTPRSAQKEIAALALKHNFWVISDEIYEKLVYGYAEHHSFAALGKEVHDRTVTVGGVSKTYAMTGWRIGWVAAPQPVAKAINELQDQVTSNPSSISMQAALAALRDGDADVARMRTAFAERRDVMYDELTGIPGFRCVKTAGAFYFFPDVSEICHGRMESSAALADYLLEEALCGMVPGEAFGLPGHLRVSYARSLDDIRRGAERIRVAVAKLP
jgi:aspartate aminotransferase